MAIKFRKLIQGLLFVSSMGFAASGGATMVYQDNFSAAGTGGWRDLGIYFSAGTPANPPDQASQSFSTGLTSVDALALTLELRGIDGNKLKNDDGYGSGGTLWFTFFLDNNANNKVQIGKTKYIPGENSDRDLIFENLALTSPSGNWTLLMEVTPPAPCDTCGSVWLSSDNPVKFSGGIAIREPATLLLVSLGLAGFGYFSCRRV